MCAPSRRASPAHASSPSVAAMMVGTRPSAAHVAGSRATSISTAAASCCIATSCAAPPSA
jgi:hypothetical protein